jgi:uncharacterized protein (UPF0332 family)
VVKNPAGVPLTSIQRRNIAREQFAKAKKLLREAVAVKNIGKAPGACVSTAYYAFEHAACAAILLYGGVGPAKSYPLSHKGIISHIGDLTAKDQDLDRFGPLLNEVYGLREDADYSTTRHPSSADADFAVRSASDFITACSKKWKSVIDLDH